jgi:hypothetical protein
MTMFFLKSMIVLPKLFGQFEGNVLTIVEFFIEFTFEFLIDPFILITGHKVGLELQERNTPNQTDLAWAKQFEERTKHIPFR